MRSALVGAIAVSVHLALLMGIPLLVLWEGVSDSAGPAMWLLGVLVLVLAVGVASAIGVTTGRGSRSDTDWEPPEPRT